MRALYLLLVVAFLPLFSAGFVYWDDHNLFTTNATVLNFDIVKMFTDLHVGGFFPLTQISLALDHRLFGVNAFAMHTENLALHAINAFLVFTLARRVFALGKRLASVVALFFLLHPMNVEAVAWITGGRKELLCTLFYLSSVLSFDRYLTSGRRRWAAATVGLGTLALLSKAMAVTLPIALLAMALLRSRVKPVRAWWVAMALLPVSILAAVLELQAQRTALHLEAVPFLTSVQTAGRGLAFAVSHFLVPHDLAVFYDPSKDLIRFEDYAALFVFGTLLAFVLWWRRPNGRFWPPLILFLVLIAPVIKLIPFGQDSVFNDRYMYLPGVALLILLALELRVLPQSLRHAMRGLETLVLVGFAALVFAQCKAWANQETLWLKVLRSYPETIKAYPNLALYYIESNQLDQALPWALKSVEATPQDPEAWSNLGVLYTRLGRLHEAEETYAKALSAHPESAMLYNNLGYVYLAMNAPERAAEPFQKALVYQPDFLNALLGLVDSNSKRGRRDEALTLLNQARARWGDRPEIMERLSVEK